METVKCGGGAGESGSPWALGRSPTIWLESEGGMAEPNEEEKTTYDRRKTDVAGSKLQEC